MLFANWGNWKSTVMSNYVTNVGRELKKIRGSSSFTPWYVGTRIVPNVSDWSELKRALLLANPRLWNIPPLPMFAQMNDLLLFSSLTKTGTQETPLTSTSSAPRPMTYQMKIPRTERSNEIFFRNCQIINKTNNSVDIQNGTGLKRRILSEIWSYFNNQFDEGNSYTWIWVCDCGTCRNMGQRF